MSALAIGDTVAGRYQVREQVGDAPGYVAYRAFDTEIEVEVALWVLRPELFPDEDRRSAFIGAAVDMRTVSNPHLLKVFDAGRHEDHVYLTSQRGTTDSLLPQPGSGVLPETELLHYASSVANALDAAHKVHCIHGRLVPSDIVHVSGLIKVGGVGLWNDIDPRAGQACWKKQERFLAPEVRRGGQAHASVAADVYSVARLVAELATGATDAKIEKALAKRDRELANALEPGLSVAPERRPKSVGALLKRLQQALLDDQLPTVENPAAAEVRLPVGGFDSGTPIDGGGFAEEDDPTRHLLSIKNAPPAKADDFPDSELAVPEGVPEAERRSARSKPNAGFGDELATVADSGVPVHQPPPPVVRARRVRETQQDGSGPGIALPGISRTPKTPMHAPPAPPKPPRRAGAAPAAPAAKSPSRPARAPSAPPVRSAPQAETAIAPAPTGPTVPPPTPAPPLQRPVDAKPPGGRPLAPLRHAVNAAPPGGAPPPMQMPPPQQPQRDLPLTAAPSQPGVKQTGPVQFVSMKPPTEPGAKKTPRVAAIDRMEKPKLRSLSELSTTGSQKSLGYYAAPSTAPSQASASSASSKLWLWVAIGGIVVGGAIIAIILATRGGSGSGDDTGKTRGTVSLDAGAPNTEGGVAPVISGRMDASVTSPCPKGMVMIPKRKVCIDQYEAPGKARQPATGMSFAKAQSRCKDRNARLCTGDEWEAACRGKNKASWPYGSSFRANKCNAGRKGAIALAGSYPECVSAAGAYDMSGNVAEWTQGGSVRGGSALNRSQGRCSTAHLRSKRERGFSDVGYRCCADAR